MSDAGDPRTAYSRVTAQDHASTSLKRGKGGHITSHNLWNEGLACYPPHARYRHLPTRTHLNEIKSEGYFFYPRAKPRAPPKRML